MAQSQCIQLAGKRANGSNPIREFKTKPIRARKTVNGRQVLPPPCPELKKLCKNVFYARKKKLNFHFFHHDIVTYHLSPFPTSKKSHATVLFVILAVPYNANLVNFCMFASHECGSHYALARPAMCLPDSIVGQLWPLSLPG